MASIAGSFPCQVTPALWVLSMLNSEKASGLWFRWIALAVLAVAVIAIAIMASTDGGLFQSSDSNDDVDTADVSDSPASHLKVRGSTPDPDPVRTEVKGFDAKKVEAEEKKAMEAMDYGTIKPIKADANVHTKSVVEAYGAADYPKRVSVLHKTKEKFDFEAFKANPKPYLNIVEPSRALSPAQPGEDVVRIMRVTRKFQTVKQGESVMLEVQALPGAPVTFTSFDLGKFENELTTITVQADKTGLASTKFFGTTGTVEDVNILAASPVTSGQAKFIVNVEWPEGRGPNARVAEGNGE